MCVSGGGGDRRRKIGKNLLMDFDAELCMSADCRKDGARVVGR